MTNCGILHLWKADGKEGCRSKLHNSYFASNYFWIQHKQMWCHIVQICKLIHVVVKKKLKNILSIFKKSLRHLTLYRGFQSVLIQNMSLRAFCFINVHKTRGQITTGWKKITLVLLKSKYFQPLFDFLQKKFAIRNVKGLQITCIYKNSFQNHTWPHRFERFR